MVNDEHPKKIVENLFSTMYYIEKKKLCFSISAALEAQGDHIYNWRG
jgi:hypothetical protein